MTRKRKDPNKPKKSSSSVLNKINAYAREYRSKHPGAKWKTAISEGSAKYRAEKR
jgi:hypothetical protein